jgi:hypothetical protein
MKVAPTLGSMEPDSTTTASVGGAAGADSAAER